MAEKIKIFELDIDVDAVVASQADLKNSLDASRESLSRLKKQGDTSSQQYVELEASVKNLSREYNSAQTQLGKLLTIQGKEIKTVKEGEAALTIINKEWSKQASLFGENSEEADKLAKKHAELKDRTNTLRKSIGDTSTNVGNYQEAITGALGELGIFGKYQQGLNDVMKGAGPIISFVSTNLKQVKDDFTKASAATTGMSKAQIAAHLTTTTLTAGLRILKIALIATGIGAIVVVLGSLVAYLATTQEGINKVNMVLTPMKEAFNAVLGSVQELGAALTKLFTLDFSGFLTDIKRIGGEMKSNIKEAVERGKEMETIQQGLNKSEADYITLQAKLRKEFEQQKKLAEDVNKPIAERESAAKKAIEAQEEISKGTIERIKQEAQILKLKQMSNDTSDAERAELATKLAEIEKALEEEAAKTTEAQNKVNSIRKEGLAKQAADAKAASDAAEKARQVRIEAAKKATEAAISESKTRLEIFIEENKGKADSLEEGVLLEEKVRDKRLSILQEELEAKKLTQSEYELAVLQTKNEFLGQQAALTKEYADKEIEAEQERLAKRRELEDLEKERKATDLQNKMEVEAGNFEGQLEIEKQRLEVQRQLELSEAEKTGADKALINKKYAQIEKDIESEKAQFKRDVASQTFGSLAEILGKETAAGKAAAIAQTTVDTYSAATAAYKAMAGIPVVGPALGAIAAAAAVVSGIKSVQKITSTKAPDIPKLESGGLMEIGGKRHSSGGTKFYGEDGTQFEAEQGELIGVVNRRAAMMVQNLNSKYPVNASSRGSNYLAAGGFITRGAQANKVPGSSIDYNLLAQKLSQANMSLPAPKIAVTEINEGQGKYAEVVNGANF